MRRNLSDIFGPSGFDARATFEPQEPLESRFADALQSFGMLPDMPIVTGEIQRCRMANQPKSGKRNGWYIYFGADVSTGIAGGVYGDWRHGGDSTYWCSKDDRDMSDQERAAYDRAVKMAQEKAQAERAARRDEAAIEARGIIGAASLAITHDYLTRKQVKAYGVYSDGSALIIPLRNMAGEVRSLQRIWPNGDKRFLAGGEVTGCFHLIGSTLTEPTYICEGYATGATIHEATGKSVVVAFNAGNLEPVARAIREAGNANQLVIAADNDRKTEGNPGVAAAEKAAAGFVGISVVAPEFAGSEGTDFNDLAVAEGMAAVMGCLDISKPKDRPPLLIKAADLQAQAPSWLVKGVLPAAGIGVLFGPSGGGKSFVVLDMALSIAAGRDWHGRKTKRQGAVIYVCGEGQQGVGNRIRAWAKHNAIDLEAVPVYVTRVPVRFLDPASITELLQAIEDTASEAGDVELIVVDTLNRNFGDGDENTTKDMTRFVDAATDVQKTLGATLLIVHHTGLGDGERARGSSALRAALDFEIQLKKSDEDGSLSLIGKKMKDGSEMTPANFSLTFIELGTDEDGEPFGSCAIEPLPADKVAAAEIADAITGKTGQTQIKALMLLREYRARCIANKPDITQVIIENSELNSLLKQAGYAATDTSRPKKALQAKGFLEKLSGSVFCITQAIEI